MARPRILKLVGQLGAEITQGQNTFAVVPFDPKYQTDGREWRFLWRLDPPSGEASETPTRSSYYEATFKNDGRYTVTVEAIDEYGLKSEPYVYAFDVALPKEDPVEVWVRELAAGVQCLPPFTSSAFSRSCSSIRMQVGRGAQ